LRVTSQGSILFEKHLLTSCTQCPHLQAFLVEILIFESWNSKSLNKKNQELQRTTMMTLIFKNLCLLQERFVMNFSLKIVLKSIGNTPKYLSSFKTQMINLWQNLYWNTGTKTLEILISSFRDLMTKSKQNNMHLELLLKMFNLWWEKVEF